MRGAVNNRNRSQATSLRSTQAAGRRAGTGVGNADGVGYWMGADRARARFPACTGSALRVGHLDLAAEGDSAHARGRASKSSPQTFHASLTGVDRRTQALLLVWLIGLAVWALLHVGVGWVMARMQPANALAVLLASVVLVFTLPTPWLQVNIGFSGHGVVHNLAAVLGLLVGAWIAARPALPSFGKSARG